MENQTLNPIVARIDQRLSALGMSRSEASAAAGLSRDAIRNLARDAGRKPRGDTLLRLASVLQTSPDWLLTGNHEHEHLHQVEAHVSPQNTPRADLAPSASPDMSRDVPVMGTASGSIIAKDFEGFEMGGPVDYVYRTPALAAARDVYAIYISGDSMEPAHPAGELRFVHPHRPVRAGCTVIVQTRTWKEDPGQAYIKRLVRRGGEKVVLEQLNPPATIEIPTEYVIALHRVLTTAELFGA